MKRYPKGARKHGRVCIPQVSGKKSICKTLDKDILEEHKTGFSHYPSLSKKIDSQGKIYWGGMVQGMAEDEKRHEKTLKQIKKSMRCKR
jgi:hypothetical protein